MPSNVTPSKAVSTRRRKPARARSRRSRKSRKTKAAAAAARRARRRARAEEARQSEMFGRAAAFFRDGKYGMARRVLQKVKTGPNTGLGHRARIYIEICNKKTARKRPKLETLEDYYNHAVRLFNDGKYPEAVRVCNRGIRMDAEAAHVHYLKAVAKVLSGKTTGAVAPLRKAIALDPSIRVTAKHDPDMESVINKRPFAKLTAS